MVHKSEEGIPHPVNYVFKLGYSQLACNLSGSFTSSEYALSLSVLFSQDLYCQVSSHCSIGLSKYWPAHTNLCGWIGNTPFFPRAPLSPLRDSSRGHVTSKGSWMMGYHCRWRSKQSSMPFWSWETEQSLRRNSMTKVVECSGHEGLLTYQLLVSWRTLKFRSANLRIASDRSRKVAHQPRLITLQLPRYANRANGSFCHLTYTGFEIHVPLGTIVCPGC